MLTFAQEGEIGDEMFIIKTGVVDVFINDEIVSELTEGEIFGEVALILDKPRTATVVTKKFCELYVLNKEDLHELLQKFPDFHSAMRKLANSKMLSFSQVVQ